VSTESTDVLPKKVDWHHLRPGPQRELDEALAFAGEEALLRAGDEKELGNAADVEHDRLALAQPPAE